MQNFKNLLASYNLILPIEELEEPEVFEPISRFDKLLSLQQNLPKYREDAVKSPILEESSTDEYGFQGFTYNVPLLNSSDNTFQDPQIYRPKSDNTSNIKLAIDFFKTKGFNKQQIGGILGNLLGESQLNPKAINQQEKNANLSGYGRGIALWSNERVLNFKNTMRVNPEEASLNQLLEFAWIEMQLRPALMKALRNSSTVEQATDAIYRGFENGSAESLASPEQLTKTYGRSWRKLGYKPYNFLNELNARIRKSLKALSYIN